MPKKDQCLKCRDYNKSQDLCTSLWIQPLYDGTECGSFSDETKHVQKDIQQSETPAYVTGIKRQKGIYSSTFIPKDTVDKTTTSQQDEVVEDAKAVFIPSFLLQYGKTIFFLLATLFLVGLCIGSKTLYQHFQQTEREEAFLLVKSYLEGLRQDKTTEFATINSYYLEDDTLYLNYRFSNIHSNEKLMGTSTEDCLMGIIAIDPDTWERISEIMSESKTNMSFVFPNANMTMPYDTLSAWLCDSAKLSTGNNYFSFYKMQEVEEYAKMHFAKDKYIKVIGHSIDKYVVRLDLSYYDVGVELGELYYDRKRMPYHFTDKVGEMGTILDGMLHVCARTGKSLEFTYEGTTKHKKYSCKWYTEEIPELLKEYGSDFRIKNRKINQARTTIETKLQTK